MQFESIASSRKQIFIIIRYILILTTGALAFVESEGVMSPWSVAILVALALASNVVLSGIPARTFFDASIQTPLLVIDTAVVAVIFMFTRAGTEFFFFFFFVLLMAAKINNLVAIGVAGLTVGLASLFLGGTVDGLPVLMRVPFFFATAVFFGYVVLPERVGDVRPKVVKAAGSLARVPLPLANLRVGYDTRLHARRVR